jgi:3-dehydroquinate dehydratase-2
VLQGPNLDRLGTREPALYGRTTLAEVHARLAVLGGELGLAVDAFQSNHEGSLVDRIALDTDAGVAGFLVNAGGLSHTSVVLRDALVGSGRPFVEVHVSNVARREPFRHVSLLADVASGVVYGFGVVGYELGLRGLAAVLAARGP